MTNIIPIIRRCQVGEEAAVWRVYFEATWQSLGRDYHPDLLERWAPRDKNLAEWAERLREKAPFVGIVDGEVVAFAELELDGHIDYFYCLPARQGRGIGKALLARIEQEARQLGLTRLFAEVSLTARDFFLSQSFVITEARQNMIQGHAAPNFIMEKAL